MVLEDDALMHLKAANDQEHGDLGFGMNAPVSSPPVFQIR